MDAIRAIWHEHPRFLVTAAVLAAAAGVYLATDVDQTITERDRRAIGRLDVDETCRRLPDFRAELECIRAIQAATLERVPDKRCASDWIGPGHEPMDFLERGYGCCFDRARLIEKAAMHYGFAIRHVSIFEGQGPRLYRYLVPGIRSHALSEVETTRGWMAVDSLYRFVGLAESGEVLTTPELRGVAGRQTTDGRTLAEPLTKSLDFDYRAVYGLYSRHGFFFAPKAPLPDVDWGQVAYNF